MNHMRKPTIPVSPWDIPDPKGGEWDYAPELEKIEAEWARSEKERAGKKPAKQSPAPVENPNSVKQIPRTPSPAGLLVGRLFQGRLNVSDLDYMAKAILQMCDENHELRERVKRLEERLGL